MSRLSHPAAATYLLEGMIFFLLFRLSTARCVLYSRECCMQNCGIFQQKITEHVAQGMSGPGISVMHS